MNKEQMRKNVGVHVRLVPTACRLDQHGFELPAIEDDWFIQDVTDDGVTISNPRTSHVKTLGYDHIYKFTTDGSRSGARRGFLSLHVQLFIQGYEVRVLPNSRPGEPVQPKRPQVVEKVVSLDYPRASGIQRALEAKGYQLGWARPDKVCDRIDLEGYEMVIEKDANGALSTFCTRDGLVLLKRLCEP